MRRVPVQESHFMEGGVQCRALSLMGMAQKCVEFERMVPS